MKRVLNYYTYTFFHFILLFYSIAANSCESINRLNGCDQKVTSDKKGNSEKAAFFISQGLFRNISCFSELEKRISCLSKKESGDAFELFAQAYFNTQKHMYFEEVLPFNEIPYSVRCELGLIKKDMGIDGIIKNNDGHYSAYQVKFRSHRKGLSWDDLSTFFGLSDRASKRILFTNSEYLSPILNKRTDFYAIKGSDLDRLTPSDFQAIENWINYRVKPTQKKKPRKHQDKAISHIQNAFKNENRATAVMACGTGKTLTSLWLAEQQNAHTILVLLPSLTLLRQTLHCWQSATSWDDFAFLCVCSDQSVAQGIDEIKIMPSDCDFPVSTKVENVNEFLSNQNSTHKIIFSTYQSCHVVAKGMPKGFSFDLAIFDEAHKTASREGAHFTFALKDQNISIKKRLFLTATPRHYAIEKKDKNGNLQLLYSMDNPQIYGKTCHNLSFGKAGKQGIICNYKLIISVVTSDMVDRELLNRGEVIIEGDIIRAKQVAHAIALKNAIEKYDLNHILTFHNSVKSAEAFASDSSFGIKTYLNNFNIFHVNGGMPTSQRELIMKEFEASPKSIMTNARCLTEGIDVPDVDLVAFMSPKKSHVDIVQAAGRAMRKSQSNKTCGYILIPLFLQEKKGEDIVKAFQRTRFDELWNVLQTMMEQDAILADIIYEMREPRKNNYYADSRLREKIEVLAPELSLINLQNAIASRIVDTFCASWKGRFDELARFKEKHGHCNVPKKYPENKHLSIWVNTQRKKYNKNSLSKEHIKQLEEIGFNWNINDQAWEDKFIELVKFKEKTGHCIVPQLYSHNKKLGSWVDTQRKYYHKNKLSKQRIERLEKIGFVWDPFSLLWEDQFAELCQFKKEHGHCNVPNKYPQNPTLEKWIHTQRINYKNKTLSKERIKKLNSIGFPFDPYFSAWNKRFDELINYKNAYGNCNVPIDYDKDPSLGQWVHTQRVRYKKQLLSKERCEKLNSLGFKWNLRKQNINQPHMKD